MEINQPIVVNFDGYSTYHDWELFAIFKLEEETTT